MVRFITLFLLFLPLHQAHGEELFTFHFPDQSDVRPITYQLLQLRESNEFKRIAPYFDSQAEEKTAAVAEFEANRDCWDQGECPDKTSYFEAFVSEHGDFLRMFTLLKSDGRLFRDHEINKDLLNTVHLARSEYPDYITQENACLVGDMAYLARGISTYRTLIALLTLNSFQQRLLLEQGLYGEFIDNWRVTDEFMRRYQAEPKAMLEQLLVVGVQTLHGLMIYNHISLHAEPLKPVLQKRLNEIGLAYRQDTAVSLIEAMMNNSLWVQDVILSTSPCAKVIPTLVNPTVQQRDFTDMKEFLLFNQQMPGTYEDKRNDLKKFIRDWQVQQNLTDDELKDMGKLTILKDRLLGKGRVGQLKTLAEFSSIELVMLGHYTNEAYNRAMLAMLQAFLKDIPIGKMEAYLKDLPRDLYDPFTDKPFRWDAKAQAVYFTTEDGPDAHRQSVKYLPSGG